jgi:hypothetical protein
MKHFKKRRAPGAPRSPHRSPLVTSCAAVNSRRPSYGHPMSDVVAHCRENQWKQDDRNIAVSIVVARMEPALRPGLCGTGGCPMEIFDGRT